MRRPLAFYCALVFIFVFLLCLLGVLPFKRSPNLPEDGEYVTAEGCTEKIIGKYILFEGDVNAPDGLYPDVRLLVSFGDDNEYVNLGENIVLEGKIRHFSHAMNPGQFDAESYYTSKGGDAFLRDATLINRDGGRYVIREGLRRLRSTLEKRLYDICPEKEASVLCDLLLGDKEGIDEKTEELYKNNGIAHILSISGLHISILGMGLFRLLRKGGMMQIPAAMVSALVLILYGMMTGMSVSATRAIGMFVIRMFAYPAKRTQDPVTSLMLMAAVVSVINPGNVTSAGFLLSYGAAFGMIVFLPAFEAVAASVRPLQMPSDRSRLQNIKSRAAGLWEALRRALRASFAVTLFTLPVQLYFFYKVSPWCIFLNLLILPCMSLLVFCAMVSLIPGLGICASVSCILLDFFEILCRGAEKLPFHTYCPGRPGRLWIVIYYALILMITLYGYLILEVRKRGLAEYGIFFDKRGVMGLRRLEKMVRGADGGPARLHLLIISSLLLILTAFPLPAPNTFTQLYVGQGNCNVTVTDAREVYIFDGGSSSEKSVGEYTILPYLRYMGLCDIDAVFISHSDTDHISGVLELIEKGTEWGVAIDAVYITRQMEEDGTENTMNLLRACEAAGVNVHTLNAGAEWNSGKTHFTCLHPAPDYIPEDPNSGSMCILAEFGKYTLLFPGDVQGSGEDALTETFADMLKLRNEDMHQKDDTGGSRRLDVYVTAHHGSAGTTTSEFLDTARPRLAINSAGLNNRYGHPAPETLARLKESGTAYLTLYETGAATIDLSGRDMKITKFCE